MNAFKRIESVNVIIALVYHMLTIASIKTKVLRELVLSVVQRTKGRGSMKRIREVFSIDRKKKVGIAH